MHRQVNTRTILHSNFTRNYDKVTHKQNSLQCDWAVQRELHGAFSPDIQQRSYCYNLISSAKHSFNFKTRE